MCHFCTPYEIHTHIQPFNGALSVATRVSRHQRGKTSLDFTEARDNEWQWHQLSLHLASGRQPRQHPPLSLLQAGCPSCRPTNSVKALKACPLRDNSELFVESGLFSHITTISGAPVCGGMTKYRKGPQRTAKDPQKTHKGPQRSITG